jgi:hypothetical protein
MSDLPELTAYHVGVVRKLASPRAAGLGISTARFLDAGLIKDARAHGLVARDLSVTEKGRAWLARQGRRA